MYYCVTAKCGHVGKNFYLLKSFAIEAEDGKEAAAKVRFLPRVKHHHKDAIKSVTKIDEQSYLDLIEFNANDPYFKCVNIYEQKVSFSNYQCERIPEAKDEKPVKEKNVNYLLKKQNQLKREASQILNGYIRLATI